MFEINLACFRAELELNVLSERDDCRRDGGTIQGKLTQVVRDSHETEVAAGVVITMPA